MLRVMPMQQCPLSVPCLPCKWLLKQLFLAALRGSGCLAHLVCVPLTAAAGWPAVPVLCVCTYRYRLCVEESYALGVLGATGRGACEAAGLQPGQVEVVVASMGTTLASVGGFCVGHHEVRLLLADRAG